MVSFSEIRKPYAAMQRRRRRLSAPARRQSCLTKYRLRPCSTPLFAAIIVEQGLIAEAIGPTLEGKTARQKNHHPLRSLAWLAWIMARLGGWNCYYKPPGPKTM